MVVDRFSFFAIQQSMRYIPYEQSEGWHDYRIFQKKCKAVYFVDDKNNPRICCWGLVRSVPFMGKILQIEGKTYNEIPSKSEIKNFYESIALYSSEKQFFVVIVSDSNLYDMQYELGIRQAGYVRPLILMTCPLTIIINFNNNDWNVHRIWKRKLKEVEKNNLKFEYIANPCQEQISVVCKMYSELAQNKKIPYSLEYDGLTILLKNNRFKLFFVYTEDDQPLLARIVYVYNNLSYDVIAANSTASRNVRGSSYYMVNSIFNWLKDNGVEQFDFGRIGPGKRSTNSVYEFKSYSGGMETPYNGEWVYSNNKFLESAFYFLLNFMKQRY
jgi:hypothetical protein